MPVERPDSEPATLVVTGIGAVCAWGWGAGALWSGLRSGAAAIGAFTRFDTGNHRTSTAAQVPDPPVDLSGSIRSWRRLSYADRFAVAAAAEAVRSAGLSPERPVVESGVWFGTSTGGMLETEWFTERMARSGGTGRSAAARLPIGLLRSQEYNGPGDAVARHLRVTGPVESISSACASAALAIRAAAAAIRSGVVEMAIAGGSDSLCQLTFAGFNSLRSVDERPCRPYRPDRAGLSIGEGAAVIVIERRDRALARGARPLAELAGWGASCDAHHMTAPEPGGTGAAIAIRAALRLARLAPERIDFVNVHGTGTPLNDSSEWMALRDVFGPGAERIPVTSTKGSIGHLLGAAGAIEAVATILCLQEGEVHPTPGGGQVDPECPARLVLDRPLPLPGASAALSTNLAFGGSNAALVFRRAGSEG